MCVLHLWEDLGRGSGGTATYHCLFYPLSLLTPLFIHILQQAHEFGLRSAPATATGAVLAHWGFTSVLSRLCRHGKGCHISQQHKTAPKTPNTLLSECFLMQSQSLYPCHKPPAFSLLPCTGTCITRRCIHRTLSVETKYFANYWEEWCENSVAFLHCMAVCPECLLM